MTGPILGAMTYSDPTSFTITVLVSILIIKTLVRCFTLSINCSCSAITYTDRYVYIHRCKINNDGQDLNIFYISAFHFYMFMILL